MRRFAAAALLALPALLAFGRGGYFGVTRVRVAILACLLLALAAFVAERPLPRSTQRPPGARRARRADGVDRPEPAVGAGRRPRVRRPGAPDPVHGRVRRGHRPAARASTGSSRRCWPRSSPPPCTACRSGSLPTLFELQTLPSAGDRLAHPLTYWNGQGALAALGLVLAAGLAARGHRCARPPRAPVLGLDLYLTLSRGAIGAGLAGLARARRAAAHPCRAPRRVVIVGAAAGARRRWRRSRCPACRRRRLVRPGRGDDRRPARRWAAAAWSRAAAATRPCPLLRPLATAALVVLLAGTVIAVAIERQPGAGELHRGRAARLGAEQPLRVLARRRRACSPSTRSRASAPARSRVEWLQRREIAEGVRDAHSLYLETAAELGLVGLLALARVPRRDRRLAARRRDAAARGRRARRVRAARGARLGLGAARAQPGRDPAGSAQDSLAEEQ